VIDYLAFREEEAVLLSLASRVAQTLDDDFATEEHVAIASGRGITGGDAPVGGAGFGEGSDTVTESVDPDLGKEQETTIFEGGIDAGQEASHPLSGRRSW